MRFLYRYYYTFFSLHLKDNHKGIKKTPAWWSALLQVGLGIGGLFLHIAMIVNFLINGSSDNEPGLNKSVVGLITVIIPTTIIYYLLFNYYGVSKETGLTPKDSFIVTSRAKLFFWSFWILSLLGMALLGRLIKVNSM